MRGALIIILAVFASCERNVKIDLPYPGDKMVLNTFITLDSTIAARVTQSASSQSKVTVFPELSGCKVELFENDVFKETLIEKSNPTGSKYYGSVLKATSGQRYTLKVAYTGFETVEGADVVPQKARFQPTEFWKEANPPDSMRPYRLNLVLNDPAGEKNFYRLRVLTASYNANTKRYTVNRNAEIPFKISNFKTNNGFMGFDDNGLERIMYFTDETFEGGQITFNLDLRYASSERIYVAPELTVLSKAAYYYFDSKQKQLDNTDNPFTEAVNVYSNIKGGYGIVGSMADSIAVIKRRN